MLRVSIHGGKLRDVSPFNQYGWVDIGYERLAAKSNYRIVMFNALEGATRPVTLSAYPRWSASLWDLVARSIALAMAPDPDDPVEEVSPAKNVTKRIAFAEAMSVIIQDHPSTGTRVRELSTMEIVMQPRAKGVYNAKITEDQRKDVVIESFLFAPERLRPCELVLRTALVALHGTTDRLPPRPALQLHKSALLSGTTDILIHRIEEPARTGFIRWLAHRRIVPKPHRDAPQGIIPEEAFHDFLQGTA